MDFGIIIFKISQFENEVNDFEDDYFIIIILISKMTNFKNIYFHKQLFSFCSAAEPPTHPPPHPPPSPPPARARAARALRARAARALRARCARALRARSLFWLRH